MLIATSILIACSVIRNTNSVDTPDVAAEFVTSVRAAEADSCLGFRFLIVNDLAYTSNIQHVDIFMEEKAFNEANLKELFAYISRKHAKVPVLLAYVKTNWAQLSPVSGDCPGSGASRLPEPPDKYDYHQARYDRRDRYEFFEYSKNLKDPNFVRVKLR